MKKINDLLDIMGDGVYVFVIHLKDENHPTAEVQLAKQDVVSYINSNIDKTFYAIGCPELDFYLTGAEVNGHIEDVEEYEIVKDSILYDIDLGDYPFDDEEEDE